MSNNLYYQVLIEMKKHELKNAFDTYKGTKNFMGVYFSDKNALFITFKNNKDLFSRQINSYKLVTIFDCIEEFENQINI